MIFVSAGHHAEKPGASYEGFNEWDEAREWVTRIVTHLGDEATQVPYGYLKEKVAFINNRDPINSLAIEIHFNAARDADGNPIGAGCETLYYPGSEKGKVAAHTVNMALATFFEPDRGIKEGWYRMDPKYGPDYFLERTACTALILEPDFIHRRKTIQGYRDSCCDLLCDALRVAHDKIQES